MTPARYCHHLQLSKLFDAYSRAKTEAERAYWRPLVDELLAQMGLTA